MTIEEQIAALDAENARLAALVNAKAGEKKRAAPTPSHNGPRSIGFLGLVEDKPGFKAFCRRTSASRCPTIEEIIAKSRKKTLAEMKAFMRPKGIWSILKDGPYSTGRVLQREYESGADYKAPLDAEGKRPKIKAWSGPFSETYKLVQVAKSNRWEWTSVPASHSDTDIVREYLPDSEDSAQDDDQAPVQGDRPVSARRAVIASWLDMYREMGMVPGLAEIKKATRDFEKGAFAA